MGVLEQIFVLPVRMLDTQLGWSWLGLGVEGARALCNAVINLTLTFTVFTFGSLLISIQVASGQYTPRIIATIIDGTVPVDLTITGLARALPHSWAKQECQIQLPGA